MHIYKSLTIIILALFLNSCGETNSNKKSDFSLQTNATNATIAINESLELELKNPKNHNIKTTSYFLDGKKIDAKTDLNNFKLGLHLLEAVINYSDDVDTLKTNITILNDVAPKVLKFEIINTYPHDITSYTQGLEFKNGILYESTGQYGESKLRKVDFKTGETLKNIELDNAYFGEGLTILNTNIYQLTWQKGKGFIYDLETLERKNSFSYGKSKEGWGLCNDGKKLYKSDGTEKIWTLNAETLTEEDYIQIYTNKGKIGALNELEWINGEIYGNIYQRDGVVIVNPKNGATKAIIDFTPLKKLVTQHDGLDVLNGIAYNPETQTIFVTGKRWDKLFEVKIIE
jgi:glutamine cyclotransferase